MLFRSEAVQRTLSLSLRSANLREHAQVVGPDGNAVQVPIAADGHLALPVAIPAQGIASYVFSPVR